MENNNWQLSTWHHDARDVHLLDSSKRFFLMPATLDCATYDSWKYIYFLLYIYMDATSLEQGYHGYVRQERAEKKESSFFFFSAATPETNSI